MLDNRWSLVHTASCHWVAQITNLVRQQYFIFYIYNVHCTLSMCSMNFVDKSFLGFSLLCAGGVLNQTNLQVECWNSLDGKTVELSSWVQGSDSAQIANNTGILKYTISQKHQFADEIKLENHLLIIQFRHLH